MLNDERYAHLTSAPRVLLVCTALALCSVESLASPPEKSGAAEQGTRAQQSFEALAGSKPLSSREIAEALRAAPLGGKKSVYEFSEETTDQGPVHRKLVRTGTDQRGEPTGYVRSSWNDPRSGEEVVRVDSTSSSWVRRTSGKNGVVLVVHNRDLRDKNGTVRLPAGSTTTLTREELGKDMRTTLRHETPLGAEQRTTTRSASGNTEQFILSRDAHGRVSEQRVRWAPDGSWRSFKQSFDGEKLRTSESDSRGRVNEQVLDRAQAEQLIAKVREGQSKIGQGLREYEGRGWLWRAQTAGHEGLGTIRARGRGGVLGTVVSGFVSPLGTRFGEVEQNHRPTGAAHPRGSQPVRTWSQRASDPRPQPTERVFPALSDITVADRVKVEQSAQYLNRAIGDKHGPFQMIIDPEANHGNAFARPTDDRFEAHVGTLLAKEGNMAALIGSGGHEMGHELDPKVRASIIRNVTLEGRAASLRKAGGYTEAVAASLHGANVHRYIERYADRASGKLTARVSTITKDPSITPADSLRRLSPRQWTPLDGYDGLDERGRARWEAYRQELKQLAARRSAEEKKSPSAQRPRPSQEAADQRPRPSQKAAELVEMP